MLWTGGNHLPRPLSCGAVGSHTPRLLPLIQVSCHAHLAVELLAGIRHAYSPWMTAVGLYTVEKEREL
jgi:hypothetical protein